MEVSYWLYPLFVLYGFLFDGVETSAGQAIWQSFDRCQKQESFNWLTETIAHITKLSIESKIKKQMRNVEKVYLVKTKSTVSIHSPMWCRSLSKTGHCVWLEQVASIFPSFVFEKKNTLNGQKACQDDQVQGCLQGSLLEFVEGITRFILGETSWISANLYFSS